LGPNEVIGGAGGGKSRGALGISIGWSQPNSK